MVVEEFNEVINVITSNVLELFGLRDWTLVSMDVNIYINNYIN